MVNTAKELFSPLVHVPPVDKASEVSLGPVAPCSVGQLTVQSAKRKNSLSLETG